MMFCPWGLSVIALLNPGSTGTLQDHVHATFSLAGFQSARRQPLGTPTVVKSCLQ